MWAAHWGNDYRFGFNGMETDPELHGEGNAYGTYYRVNDPRIARWTSIDRLATASWSPYNSMDNNPIIFTDILGDKVQYGRSGRSKSSQKRIKYQVKRWARASQANADQLKAWKKGSDVNAIFDDRVSAGQSTNIDVYTAIQQTNSDGIVEVLWDAGPSRQNLPEYVPMFVSERGNVYIDFQNLNQITLDNQIGLLNRNGPTDQAIQDIARYLYSDPDRRVTIAMQNPWGSAVDNNNSYGVRVPGESGSYATGKEGFEELKAQFIAAVKTYSDLNNKEVSRIDFSDDVSKGNFGLRVFSGKKKGNKSDKITF